jgi:hypothetical protein
VASRDAARRELASLKAELAALKAARAQHDSAEDVAARIRGRSEASQREQAEYEAMTAPEKIIAKQKQLAELDAGPPAGSMWAAEYRTRCPYRRRALEIDIAELEGTEPAVIQLARDQACEAGRFGKPLPKIPSPEEAGEIIAAQRAQETATARVSAPVRQRRAHVIEISDYLAHDKLADFRGGQQPQLEPPHV